ncbi:MAG: phytanoyl-CoA dioxygenase family protein [Halobacteriovoraceae bacterium]|nr:phytanoyl-CoA dioxygenase family protein [Halobacteriovoraceae bacterium]MCB9093855.1 phytanoyl-CoA dioxygenase family protein [Halobacteriovoraceae bacterium]
MALTREQKKLFFERGWFSLPNLFTIDEIEVAKKSFQSLVEKANKLQTTQNFEDSYFVLDKDQNNQVIIKRVVWAGGTEPALLELGRDNRITSVVSELLDSKEIVHLLNQAHFKRPFDGVIFDWHQDIQHRDKGPGTWTDVDGKGSYIQTALVLDEMTTDNGPLLFIPGSSQWGVVDFGKHDYDNPNYDKKLPPQFDKTQVQTITATPGSVLFFGPYTAHASFENNSESWRRILINGYAYPGANHRTYPGSGKGISLFP